MLVADCPELLEWLNGKLQSVVWPVLTAQFGEEVTRGMWLYDAFLLKFDEQPGRAGLGLHVDDDGLGISINVRRPRSLRIPRFTQHTAARARTEPMVAAHTDARCCC